MQFRISLTSLINTKSCDMRIELAQIKRCDVEPCIRERQKHGSIDRGIMIPRRHVGLESKRRLVPQIDVQQPRVRNVQLRYPCRPPGHSSRGIGYVAVIWPDELSGSVPVQENLAAWVGERDSAVLGDGWRAVERLIGRVGRVLTKLRVGDVCRGKSINTGAGGLVESIRSVDTSRIRLIEDTQRWEVLPYKPSLVGRAARDVWRQQSPCPTLRNCRNVPNGHGELSAKLAEYELLTSLHCDALEEQLGRRSIVQMRYESIGARFSHARELLVEVKELPNIGHGIIVSALLGCLSTEDVGQERSMSHLLIGHVLNEESIICVEAAGIELIGGEVPQAEVKEIPFNPFLVESQRKRLVVIVTLGSADGSRSIGSQATIWSKRRRLRAVELAVSCVVEGSRSRRRRWNL